MKKKNKEKASKHKWESYRVVCVIRQEWRIRSRREAPEEAAPNGFSKFSISFHPSLSVPLSPLSMKDLWNQEVWSEQDTNTNQYSHYSPKQQCISASVGAKTEGSGVRRQPICLRVKNLSFSCLPCRRLPTLQSQGGKINKQISKHGVKNGGKLMGKKQNSRPPEG